MLFHFKNIYCPLKFHFFKMKKKNTLSDIIFYHIENYQNIAGSILYQLMKTPYECKVDHQVFFIMIGMHGFEMEELK